MFRWVLLLMAAAAIYWIYQRDYAGGGSGMPKWETAAPSATLPPGDRLGGGLNPFVTDTDIDAPAQRPPLPKIPK